MNTAINPRIWAAVAVALLAMPLVSMRTNSKLREVQEIICVHERRAHAHWVHAGEVGPEPAMQDCE